MAEPSSGLYKNNLFPNLTLGLTVAGGLGATGAFQISRIIVTGSTSILLDGTIALASAVAASAFVNHLLVGNENYSSEQRVMIKIPFMFTLPPIAGTITALAALALAAKFIG